MNKKILKTILQTKVRTAQVKSFLKGKEYDKIFELYGSRVYSSAVPRKYKKEEVNKLIKQGRFEDIYRLYGEEEYSKLIGKMQAIDVYNETGNKTKSIFSKLKNFIRSKFLPYTITSSLVLGTGVQYLVDNAVQDIYQRETNMYNDEIIKYNNRIEKYAEQISALNLTDLQVIMKIMSDMWEEIDGYGIPKINATTYMRLDIQENGVGVCRNMADDMTTKLNMINPDFNARNLLVNLNDNETSQDGFTTANIERKQAEQENLSNDELQQLFDTNNNEGILNTGNHMVTVAEMSEDNTTLIIDPTNANLGVFVNRRNTYVFQ